MGLDNEPFSRISCVSNDQIPTLGNIMSTVTTNIQQCHISHHPHATFFWGNMDRILIEQHNPVLQDNTQNYFKIPDKLKIYKIATLLGSIFGRCLWNIIKQVSYSECFLTKLLKVSLSGSWLMITLVIDQYNLSLLLTLTWITWKN